jgi:UDP-N-acetylglucosamine/UDP-N-acetylgalactosamine diphosphorylase
METAREDEFAPVKNATGKDSAESAREMMIEQYARWFETAGVEVPRDSKGKVVGGIQISPLCARTVEELSEKLGPGTEFVSPMIL